MSDKSKEKESVKHLEDVKGRTNDQELKDKIDKKLAYINKPISK